MNCKVVGKQVFDSLVDKNTGLAYAVGLPKKEVFFSNRELSANILTLDQSDIFEMIAPRNCKSNYCPHDLAGIAAISPISVTGPAGQRNLSAQQKIASYGKCAYWYGQSACDLKFILQGEENKFDVVNKTTSFRWALVKMHFHRITNFSSSPDQFEVDGGLAITTGHVDYSKIVSNSFYQGQIAFVQYDCNFN